MSEGVVGRECRVHHDVMAGVEHEWGSEGHLHAVVSLRDDSGRTDEKCAVLPLAPGRVGSGYLMFNWPNAQVLFVGGAEGLWAVSTDHRRAVCIAQWEDKEVAAVGPWFVEASSGRTLFVATVDRVIVVGRDPAVARTWWARSVNASTQLSAPPRPTLDGLDVTLCDGRTGEETTLQLNEDKFDENASTS